MKTKFDIEQKHLKENPFGVPDGYFSTLQQGIAKKISSSKVDKEESWIEWSLVRPRIALAMTFTIVFIIAYGSLSIFIPESNEKYKNTLIETNKLIEEGYIPRTFGDMATIELDDNSLSKEENVNPEQIIEYLTNNNVNIICLTSVN